MKVILTDKVKSLGNAGDLVKVSEGYARNFLIPNKVAMLADESNSKQMADYQKMLNKKIEEQKTEAQAIANTLKNTDIKIIKKVGGNGSLFGTVTSNELASHLQEKNINVEKRQITIDPPIKTLGTYEIHANLFKGVDATFKVTVEADPKQMEELKKKQAAAEKDKAEREEMQAKAQADEAAKAEQGDADSEEDKTAE